MNMKKRISVLTIVIVVGLVTFPVGNMACMSVKAVSPQAEPFWQYLTKKSYRQWRFFPGHTGMYPGKSPHGAYLKLYANDLAYKATKNNEPMPEGAILVKENYGKDQSTLMAITPMYKAAGYNPEAGNWFWAKYGADGKVMTSGKVDSCISCHREMGGGDYVVTDPK